MLNLALRFPTRAQTKIVEAAMSLVCGRSEMSNKALNGDWKEAEARKVLLQEDEPSIFALHAQLLYTRELPLFETSEGPTPPAEGIAAKYLLLSKLYVLAEKLIDERTKKIVLAALRAASKEQIDATLACPPIESVRTVYEGTPDASPARALFAKLYAESGRGLVRSTDSSDWPQEFLLDLTVSMFQLRTLPQKERNVLAGPVLEPRKQKPRSIKELSRLIWDHSATAKDD